MHLEHFFLQRIMTDQEIVNGLIERDPRVTAQFFYKDSRPLMLSVIRRVFGKQRVDYDEIISELYIHLMENDANRLRQFKFESTFRQWLKTTTIRFCLKLKIDDKVIDDESMEHLDNGDNSSASAEALQAKIDVDALLNQMRNQRYAKVIRMLVIDDMEPEAVAKALSVTVGNLYNIKRRAMAAFADVALKDKRQYEQR